MGVFILHQWGALLAMVSGTFVIWGGIWGIMYRKYFWDIIGGTLGPAGIIPPPQAALFISLIVDVPVLQVVNILNGLFTLAIEWPLPILAGTAIQRSLVVRAVFYIWSGVIAILVYQTVDAGVFYGITAMVYLRAIALGEVMEGSKANRGKVGAA